MARRKPPVEKLVQKALPKSKAQKAAIGAVVAGGVLSAAKLERDRLASADNPRRFRLDQDEPVPDGLTRISLGQLDTATDALQDGSDEDLAESVHEARKAFKRLRAIIRLARDELGEQAYRRENRTLRNLGRRLSAARDGKVLLDTLDSLSQRHPELTPSDVGALRELLAAERMTAEQQIQRGGDVSEVVRQLHELRPRAADWPLAQDGLASLAPGFRRTYRRARRAYRRARRNPTSENFHELRKRTKDLWYTAQILRSASPDRMERLAQDAHQLSDLIGEEHDLGVLAERVEMEPNRRIDGLPEVIERRRSELRAEALALGKRLFRRKPRKMARLLDGSATA